MSRNSMAALLFPLGLIAVATPAPADELMASSWEARTYLYFNARPEAVQAALPAGWSAAPGSGALQDANLWFLFVDGITAEDAKGAPRDAQGKLGVWLVPAHNAQTGASGLVVLGGLASDPKDAPGPYAVFAPTDATLTRTERAQGGGPTVVQEQWDFGAASQDRLHLDLTYARDVAKRGHVEPHVYSAAQAEPSFVYKIDQAVDLVRGAAGTADRVQAIQFSASGPRLGALMDGSEQLVAVSSVPHFYRQVWKAQ